MWCKNQAGTQTGLAEINAPIGPGSYAIIEGFPSKNNSSVQVGPTNFKPTTRQVLANQQL